MSLHQYFRLNFTNSGMTFPAEKFVKKFFDTKQHNQNVLKHFESLFLKRGYKKDTMKIFSLEDVEWQ